MQGKPPATKRAALGVITNQTRIQPSRAAKPKGLSTEGQVGFVNNAPCQSKKSAFSVPTSSLQTQGFSIHVDDQVIPTQSFPSEVHMVCAEQTTVLPNARTREPEPIIIEDTPIAESPMVLDISSCHSSDTLDTEEERMNKILTVPEYSAEIYRYLRECELRHQPKPHYMKKQPDITNSMRCILVDWLVEVAEEYKLHRETLCLSVNYIDRFLSQMSVLRGKLQLVGAASMFLAAKFEEIYPPDVGEFVFITDDTYTKKQVLRMEHLILKVLSFDVAVPTVNCFCEKFLKTIEADERTQSLAMYLAELSLVDAETYLQHIPSVTAAAAVCLANHTLGNEPWPRILEETTGYSTSDFKECLHHLMNTFSNAPSHPQQAIREKYKQAKYHQVALLCPPTSGLH